MSDIYGFDDDEFNMPPPAALRGFASPHHIPVVRVAESKPAAPLPVAQISGPVNLPAIPEDTTFTDIFNGFSKMWNSEVEREDRRKEINELLAALKQPPIPEVAAAQAKVLDPTQAPDGAPVQVDVAGVPQNYFSRNRTAESGGDDAAVNKSTGAAGRYQFLPSTAEGIRKANPQLNISDNWRTNAEDQEKLMQAYTQQSVGIIKNLLKRDPTGGELYMLHLLGHGGGPAVLNALDQPLTTTVSAEARRLNPVLQRYKTGRELLNYFNRSFS